MPDAVIAVLNRLTDDEDADAVLRCQRGDADAFEILVERHQKRMLNVAYRMLGDYDEACDAVQEAFLAAWRAIRSFRREAKFSTWLYGIVVNHARTRMRKVQALSRHEAASIDDPAGPQGDGPRREVPDCGETGDERLERKEIEARVQQCIGTLDAEFREVLVLRDIQGFSYEEIGGMLHLPEGTVKSRLFRARAVLKDCLVRVLGEWP
ncbi:MAG: ECF RNA polymerase sigma factor SigW [Syntrophaceae bacterium PtaB.Bin038]|nr:MAG: ECF RNA polymerase sigma factor SigW [Syntrophaceae bacterium PtaB.Bin038]